MRHPRISPFSLAVVASLLLVRAAGAAAVADFQARLAQTLWTAQQTEAILRTLPQSTSGVSTPDGLAAYVRLLGENATVLNTLSAARPLTDADRKAFADGLNAVVTSLRDQSALASNRGLAAVVSTFSSLEEVCRTSIAQLSAVTR